MTEILIICGITLLILIVGAGLGAIGLTMWLNKQWRSGQ